MTTASVAGAAPDTKNRSQSSWLIRWSPLGGLLFVLGFIVVMSSPLGDGRADSAAEYVDHALSNSGWLNAGLIFVLASLLLVPWFVVGLYARLRSIGAETESILALIGGVTFSVLFFVGMTIWIAPALYLPDRDDPALRLRDAETFLGIAELNWFMLGGAGVGLGLMIFCRVHRDAPYALCACLGGMRVDRVWANCADERRRRWAVRVDVDRDSVARTVGDGA